MEKVKNKSPVIIVAPKLGAHSEVWLYRQATQIPEVETVVCSEHLNRQAFPARGVDVQFYPKHETPKRSPLVEHISLRFNQLKRNFFGKEFYSLSAVEDLWWSEFYKEHPNSTVLFHYGVTAAKFASIAARSGIRFGIHFNGYDLSRMLRDKLYVNQLRRTAENASFLIVVADYMKQKLLSLGIGDSKIHYIPYGVPLRDFECNRLGRAGDLVTFLMVGRLTPKKHPVATIRAFGLCSAKCPNARLRVIGSGELERSCKDIVSKLGLQDKIIFHGAMQSKDVCAAMCESDVFVQHSITSKSGDMEGWPVAIAEAAGSGLAIISTHHASIPDQVIHGKTGFLVDEGDWRAMGEKMAILASQHELRDQFGLASREHISQWEAETQILKLANTIQESNRGA